jgi:hypothetical protein
MTSARVLAETGASDQSRLRSRLLAKRRGVTFAGQADGRAPCRHSSVLDRLLASAQVRTGIQAAYDRPRGCRKQEEKHWKTASMLLLSWCWWRRVTVARSCPEQLTVGRPAPPGQPRLRSATS